MTTPLHLNFPTNPGTTPATHDPAALAPPTNVPYPNANTVPPWSGPGSNSYGQNSFGPNYAAPPPLPSAPMAAKASSRRLVGGVLAASLMVGVVGAGASLAIGSAFRSGNTEAVALQSGGELGSATMSSTSGPESGAEATHGRVDQEALRKATVLLVAGEYRGSGAIVSADGLILTNAHVAAPDAMGQGVLYHDREAELARTPAKVDVYLSKGADEPAERAYEAELVAVDGYLDLAVLQIVRTAGGKILKPTDLALPHVEMGDSQALGQDADVVVYGYPTIADTGNVTIVRGTVAGFVSDDRVRDNRAYINSTAPIAGGNSGGMAVDIDGRMIGIPTSERFDRSQRNSFSRFRPVHLAAPLVDEARTSRADGKVFRSTTHSPAPTGKENVGDNTLIRPLDSPLSIDSNCQAATKSSAITGNTVGVAIPFSGFGTGRLDIRVDLRKVQEGPDKIVGSVTNEASITRPMIAKGCMLVAITSAEPLEAKTQYRIDVYVGGNAHDLDNNGVFTLK